VKIQKVVLPVPNLPNYCLTHNAGECHRVNREVFDGWQSEGQFIDGPWLYPTGKPYGEDSPGSNLFKLAYGLHGKTVVWCYMDPVYEALANSPPLLVSTRALHALGAGRDCRADLRQATRHHGSPPARSRTTRLVEI